MASAHKSRGENIQRVIHGWLLSRHAREALARRGFTPAAVARTLRAPEQRYTSYDRGPDRWVYQWQHVALAVSPVTRTVITVLLREYAEWDDGDTCRVNAQAAA